MRPQRMREPVSEPVSEPAGDSAKEVRDERNEGGFIRLLPLRALTPKPMAIAIAPAPHRGAGGTNTGDRNSQLEERNHRTSHKMFIAPSPYRLCETFFIRYPCAIFSIESPCGIFFIVSLGIIFFMVIFFMVSRRKKILPSR